MDTIYAHSCESMTEIADNSVALAVTSPPYWNAIDYDIHATDKRRYWRTRTYKNGFGEYEEYLEWLGKVFGEICRVTRPGGFCAVVIGTVLLNGRHFPVPFHATERALRSGWEFHQDFIWHKCTAGVRRAGVSIQKPYPGYFYPNIMTEYILVFRKPGPPRYRGKSQQELKAAAYTIDRVFTMDVANNIWHIAPVPPNVIDHPCPFPEEIPHRLIKLYSYPGEIVLDPFAGSGQTLKVAKHLGRHYIGYEIVEQYVQLARRRIHEPLHIRQEQLVVSFGKVPVDSPAGNAPLPRRPKVNTRALFDAKAEKSCERSQ